MIWDLWHKHLENSNETKNDDSVYEHLTGLMGVYRRVIAIAQTTYDNPAVRALVFGICEVLASRVSEFEENNGGTDLIEREWEELGTIIKVQVLALEEANIGENTAIPSILDALRESYQQLGPVIENMQSILHSPPGKAENCITFEEFESRLLAAQADLPQSPEREDFLAALDEETAVLLDGINTKKEAYTLQRTMGAEVLLAEEITGVFEKVVLPDETTEAAEREILAGIKETIEIKVQSLKESVQAFVKQGGETIRKFTDEKPEIPDEEKKAIIAGVRAAWFEEPPQEVEISAFLDLCLNGGIFAPCLERMENHVRLYTDTLEKQLTRFKREILLYEICTYEEILTHSVSRLRESKNPVVLSAVLILDDTFRALEVILKKNNIFVIRPAVKEIFNAKEHEVLVAEKNDEFEKGEIIKVMTAGYKYKEQIILRANVIAAR
jgi:hypothetical protein